MHGHERIGPAVPGIVEAEVDDGLGLYRAAGDQVVVLNSTAADVWRLADGTHSFDDVVRLLASSYGVAPTRITADVEVAIATLRGHGFLATPD